MSRRILFDIDGAELTAADRVRLKHPNAAGIVLFAPHCQSHQQLRELCQEVKAINPQCLITIDQEGGRVQRMRADSFTQLPSMRSIGSQWQHDPFHSIALAHAVGIVMAGELRACGVDLSLAPVLDIDYANNTVIGERAFSPSAQITTVLASALMLGMAQQGMANCAKHFPGHGFVSTDSHLESPVDTRNLQQMAGDLQPYQALAQALTAVMPAHIVYPEQDAHAAGFSRYWLQSVLREQLGFGGVIISDDLKMQGARQAGDVVAAGQMALTAGCDLLLLGWDRQTAEQLLEQVSGPEDAALNQRFARLFPNQPAITWETLEAQPHFQSARTLLHRHFDCSKP